MSGVMVLCAAGLCATGTYLVTARSLSRILLGFSLLGHGAVIALLAAGGLVGSPPLADRPDIADSANPLPQALALTAIVISFGLSLFLLGLARRQHELTGDDLVEDDLEDIRIAQAIEDGDFTAPGTDASDGGDDQ